MLLSLYKAAVDSTGKTFSLKLFLRRRFCLLPFQLSKFELHKHLGVFALLQRIPTVLIACFKCFKIISTELLPEKPRGEGNPELVGVFYSFKHEEVIFQVTVGVTTISNKVRRRKGPASLDFPRLCHL